MNNSSEHYTAFDEIRMERVGKMVTKFSAAIADELKASATKQDAAEFLAAVGLVMTQCIEITVQDTDRALFNKVIQHQVKLLTEAHEKLISANVSPVLMLAQLSATIKLTMGSTYIRTGINQFKNLNT